MVDKFARFLKSARNPEEAEKILVGWLGIFSMVFMMFLIIVAVLAIVMLILMLAFGDAQTVSAAPMYYTPTPWPWVTPTQTSTPVAFEFENTYYVYFPTIFTRAWDYIYNPTQYP